MAINTSPNSYAPSLVRRIHGGPCESRVLTDRVVGALQEIEPRMRRKAFRRAVLNAIFDDCLALAFVSEKCARRVWKRTIRLFGREYGRRLLIHKCDILDCWRFRDCHFIPDAYVIYPEDRTVVCYEVENTHHLNATSLTHYADAWWTLEYICWDLHLIAYDVYGHPRIIQFPETGFLAEPLM